MADEPGRILSVAASVADGRSVDWDKERSSVADADERDLIDQLRVVEQLALPQRESAPQMPGRWGNLEIRALIGWGAYGSVYRAFDPRLDREVALKLLPVRHLPNEQTVIDEGRLLARVRHPNVVTVFGADVHDGFVGIWAELVSGQTLDARVRETGRMSAREAGAAGQELCRALAAVHAAGLIHRDIKARNVMREEGGRFVLMDFGAGREQMYENLTESGARVESGTPIYMAPEVLHGAQATTAADIYSLGVLLYFLVTADYPVRGASVSALREAHSHGSRTLLRDARPDLPGTFVQAVEQALDPDPARRPLSAGALERALSVDASIHSPGSRRNVWLAAAAVLIVMVSAGAALMLSRREPLDPAALRSRTQEPAGADSPRLSAEDLHTVTSMNNLAALYAAMGAYERAVPLYEKSLSIQENALGGDSPDVAATLAGLGAALEASGASQRAQSIRERASALPAPPVEPPPAQASLTALGSRSAVSPAPYVVEAALYRREGAAARRLTPDDPLAAADRVYLEFKSTMQAFVYVLNEDDHGESYLLFPLRGSNLDNPLPAGKAHMLPGNLDGRQAYWQVTSAGGHERLLVIASPSRLTELEEEIALMERPREGRPVMATRLSDAGVRRLRGIGGLAVEGNQGPLSSRAPGRIFEMARRLASGPESAHGVWIRQVELSNPAD